jgi:fluoride ion exporter CrcB/FEX
VPDPRYLTPHRLEKDVVHGYVKSEEAKPDSIEVRYRQGLDRPEFAEEKNEGGKYANLFLRRPDPRPDWQASFFESLDQIDGIVLLGGRSTTLTGIVATKYQKPILACAGYGGAASKLWESLNTHDGLLTQPEIDLMAADHWTTEMADRAVQALLDQGKRLAERRAEAQAQTEESRRSRQTLIHSITAIALLVLGLLMLPPTWDNNSDLSYRTILAILVVSPMLAGISGATIRVVFNAAQKSTIPQPPPLPDTIGLGMFAGAVAGLLFYSSQLIAIPDKVEPNLKTIQASRLIPFALGIGFLAGLTTDSVYRNLICRDALKESSVRQHGPEA